MRFAIAVLVCACSGSSPSATDASVDPPRDAAIDPPIDARPATPRQLALATIGTRSRLRVYVATATSFRTVFDVNDPAGFGSGIAWTDYDHDGLDDLVSTFAVPDMLGQNEMIIVHNDGDPGLTIAGHRMMNPSLLHGYDAESDGDGDVYIGTPGGPDRLFRASGGQLPQVHNWSEPGNSFWEYGIASGDMTGDGLPEVVLARGLYGEAISRGTMGAPSPAWSQPATGDADSTTAAMVDFDGDGVLDASFGKASSSGTTGSIEVYRWNGSTFVSMWSTTEFGGVASMDWADVDSDGAPDLALCLGTGVLRVFHRNGLTFTPNAINASDVPCLRLSWGDYDIDGDPDLAVAGNGLDAGITIFNNNAATLTAVFHDDTAVSALAWGRCGLETAACFTTAPSL